MENKLSHYACALWIVAAIFLSARYISAAVMAGLADPETFRVALKALGPFLPAMAIICLAGGALLLIVDLVLACRKKEG